MKKQKQRSIEVQQIQITACNFHIHIVSNRRSKPNTAYMVKKWHDDIRWWLEIIRLPEILLPKKPQLIPATNRKQHNVQYKQIINK